MPPIKDIHEILAANRQAAVNAIPARMFKGFDLTGVTPKRKVAGRGTLYEIEFTERPSFRKRIVRGLMGRR